VITRELTKKFEEICRGTLSELRFRLEGEGVRGEVTLLVEGLRSEAVRDEPGGLTARIRELQGNPALTTKDIVGIIVSETGLPRSRVYREVIAVRSRREKS